MEFRILGSLEAESDGRLLPLGWPFERRMLAALLLDAGRAVPVPRLVDVAWDDPPATAGKQVMNAMSRLRRALGGVGGPSLIETVVGGYRLAADRCVVDARVFEAGVASAGRAASEGKTAEAAGLLRSALALWRGPALAGLAGRGLEQAAAWDERRAAAQETYYGLELALGRHREILGELAGLAASCPLRERLAGLYMSALYRCGRQAEALTVYRMTRELLASELGLDPGPELRGLQQQILTADPALGLLGAGWAAGPAAGSAVLAAEAGSSPVSIMPQVRYSLPADIAGFTGRGGEQDQILAAVKDAAAAGGVVAIHAIDGMPGVGKTALAVHAAHALARDFPDRQMFLDLHGHTPGREPVHPEDALAGLLAATGVDPRYLPGDLEGRAGMWRDRMAGQRAVLVLDNAASSAQVTPLLPGISGCLVLVTSRRHLGDLPGVVTPVPLDTLPPPEATAMFIRLVPRATSDPEGVAEVVALAGHLPLAISLLARVLARHPSWTLGDLAGEVRARLLTLTAENSSVAAAFEVSYRCLDGTRQRFFCVLGLHPGTVTDAYAAAALAGTSAEKAAAHLEVLYGEGLLTETGYRRYGMHDLIRRYARDQAASGLGEGESERALDRLLDYYQHTTALAGECLARSVRPSARPSVPAGMEVPGLEDASRALAWLRADRASLAACLDHVARATQHARVMVLAAGLAAVMRRDGPWADALRCHAIAIDAAQLLRDRLSEADALIDLGTLRNLMGEHLSAAQVVERALGIYRDLGERSGEANALRELGRARRVQGDVLGSFELLEQGLDIFRDLGDRLGEADALADLGITRQQTSDYQGATVVLEQALGIFRGLGDRFGEAWAEGNLGIVWQKTGEYTDAIAAMQRSLDVFGDLGDRLGQADALTFIGVVLRLTGDFTGSAEVLQQALGIFRDIGGRPGEANVLANLGVLRRLTDDLPGAAMALEQAASIYRDLGDRQGEANSLNEQGTLDRVGGDIVSAEARHQEALEVARAISSPHDEAEALAGLGRCAIAVGNVAQAKTLLRQAHEICHRIGAAAAAHDILAELDTLTGLTPALQP